MNFKYSVHLIVLVVLVSCKYETSNDFGISMKINDIEVLKDSLRLIPEKGLVFYKDEPFSGISIEYYPDDLSLAERMPYHEGIKHGHTQKWFEDGLLSYEAYYDKGQLIDSSRTWWKNGNIRSQSFYIDGEIHGTQRQWYISGALFKELNYNMGVEEGMQKAWRENGKIYNNFETKNGRIFGLKRANLCFSLDNEEIKTKE